MSCCAPCSAGAIAQCARDPRLDDFLVLFYNPNIFPESEYQKRLAEQIRLCESRFVKYAVIGADDYDAEHAAWRECVRGLENEPEQGDRCDRCFRHRFAFGAKWARAHGYNAIASVFGVSHHKDQTQVDAAAKSAIINDQLAIKYIPIDWDEDLRVAENKKACFYRQKYCGCEFSQNKTSG